MIKVYGNKSYGNQIQRVSSYGNSGRSSIKSISVSTPKSSTETLSLKSGSRPSIGNANQSVLERFNKLKQEASSKTFGNGTKFKTRSFGNGSISDTPSTTAYPAYSEKAPVNKYGVEPYRQEENILNPDYTGSSYHKVTHRNADGTVSVYDCDFWGNPYKETKYYYDKDNNLTPSTLDGNVTTKITKNSPSMYDKSYTIDNYDKESGKLLKKTTVNNDGSTTVVEYDSDGNKIKQGTYYSDPDGPISADKRNVTYYYDKDGKVFGEEGVYVSRDGNGGPNNAAYKKIEPSTPSMGNMPASSISSTIGNPSFGNATLRYKFENHIVDNENSGIKANKFTSYGNNTLGYDKYSPSPTDDGSKAKVFSSTGSSKEVYKAMETTAEKGAHVFSTSSKTSLGNVSISTTGNVSSFGTSNGFSTLGNTSNAAGYNPFRTLGNSSSIGNISSFGANNSISTFGNPSFGNSSLRFKYNYDSQATEVKSGGGLEPNKFVSHGNSTLGYDKYSPVPPDPNPDSRLFTSNGNGNLGYAGFTSTNSKATVFDTIEKTAVTGAVLGNNATLFKDLKDYSFLHDTKTTQSTINPTEVPKGEEPYRVNPDVTTVDLKTDTVVKTQAFDRGEVVDAFEKRSLDEDGSHNYIVFGKDGTVYEQGKFYGDSMQTYADKRNVKYVYDYDGGQFGEPGVYVSRDGNGGMYNREFKKIDVPVHTSGSAPTLDASVIGNGSN